MKNLFLTALISSIALCALAQEREIYDRNLTFYISAGGQEINNRIDQTLVQQGFQELGDDVGAVEFFLKAFNTSTRWNSHIGITYLEGNNRNEVSTIIPNLNTSRRLWGWGFKLGLGYSLIETKVYELSPSLSWGLQKLNFDMVRGIDDNSLGGILSSSDIERFEFNHSGGYFDLGIKNTFFVRSRRQDCHLGISFGYRFDPGDNEWTLDETVSTDFDLDMNGYYVNLQIGIGKRTRPEKK